MAVADVIVSKGLEMLISGIFSEAEQNFKLLVGVEKEVKMLTDNLRSIQAVLFDAEKRQLKEETVKLWLQRLKNISYDIDDVLDEWSTEILKSKFEGHEYEYAPKPKRAKVWSFVLSFFFCFHEVGFRHDIAVKIKELSEYLDVIAKEKDRYGFLLIEGNEQVERVMTTSVANIAEVKGRQHDENEVINLLLAESSETPNPHVISVVGMGGIGKTTLAKLVYNEDRVKSHFDTRIWVCVSDPFDEHRIAKAILESVQPDTASNVVELQSIVRKIQQCIGGKKFLLVLDDVWNEDSNKWGRIEEFLRCGSSGSKVLVTTRSQKVAEIIGHRDHIIRLGLLSNEECWSIFSQLVFLESTSMQCNSSLVEIGRKIVARCKGLPLAVKTIGGLLRCKDSVEEWQKVLDSELWEVEEVKRGVLAPLLLSYHDLSPALKQCFLYCVIFPKDHRMSKKKLIGMWMSQGYLRAMRSKDMMEIGEEYFQHLAMRSLFQDFEEDYVDSSNGYCKMHDLVHDFGQSIMKNESVSLKVNGTYCAEPRIDFNFPNEIRHAVIVVAQSKASFPCCVYNFKTLRSLRFLPTDQASMVQTALPCIFNKLMCLRSLSLIDCCIEEIPLNISKLIHLRELDLSGNLRLSKLPEAVCNLYNLQTLVLDECARMESIPQGMGKLINLRCLYNTRCESLRLPKCLGRLSGLQRLSWLNICHDGEQEEASLSLRDMENLNDLGGCLEIRWSRQLKADVDVRDARQAQLKAKKHLIQLVLNLGDVAEWRKEGEDEELLEALEPPPNLKYLEIYNYQGIKMCCSSWIPSLSFLRKLYLCYWRNCKQLPALGKLPSLESLTIYDFKRLKKVGGEFLGMDHLLEVGAVIGTSISAAIILFPKLVELEFSRMNEWEEWNYEGEVNDAILKIMPFLSTLILSSCPKLKNLPYYIRQNTSLKYKTWNCKALHL